MKILSSEIQKTLVMLTYLIDLNVCFVRCAAVVKWRLEGADVGWILNQSVIHYAY